LEKGLGNANNEFKNKSEKASKMFEESVGYTI